MSAQLIASLFEVSSKACSRLFGEDIVQSVADRVEFGRPKRIVFSLVQGVKVHVELIFGQGRRHQLFIAA